LILVDTSAWVEYLRSTGSAVHLELRRLIARDAPLATTDPVVMELLAGARDGAHVRTLRRLLLRFDHLPIEGLGDYEGAAAIYRWCRDKGDTVRSLIDCLIATVAIREGAPVLEQDRDFKVIAAHTELKLQMRR
jgi:predicted nucleic acid-binding protein